MIAISPLAALVEMLKADPIVVHAAGTVTIYGETVPAICGEIDDEWSRLMPRRVVLVQEAGGLPRDDVGPLSPLRFDVRCYGADAWGASELSRQVFNRLFGAANRATGIVAITLAAGPDSGRESGTGWAWTDRSYDVLAG